MTRRLDGAVDTIGSMLPQWSRNSTAFYNRRTSINQTPQTRHWSPKCLMFFSNIVSNTADDPDLPWRLRKMGYVSRPNRTSPPAFSNACASQKPRTPNHAIVLLLTRRSAICHGQQEQSRKVTTLICVTIRQLCDKFWLRDTFDFRMYESSYLACTIEYMLEQWQRHERARIG